MGYGHSLLIVEDDSVVRSSLKAYLENSGYFVESAENGFEGLEKAKQRNFDLIISDIMMPQMSGLTFLEKVKKLYPDVDVVMMTGYPDLAVSIEAMRKGAADFIQKPFLNEYMGNVVSGILKGKSKSSQNASTPSEFSENLNRHLERKIQELSILQAISESMEDLQGASELFTHLCDLSIRICGAKTAAYYLYDNDRDCLVLQKVFPTQKGFDRPEIVKLPHDIRDALEKTRQPSIFYNTGEIPFCRQVKSNATTRPRSCILAPFYVRNEYFGLLSVEEKDGNEEFTEEDITYVKVLLRKAGLSIENKALYETIYNNLISTLHSLVSTIEAKDPYTRSHSDRVTRLAVMIGKEMGCTVEEIDTLKFAAILHDIGKIGVSDAVLQKKGSLTSEEYEMIKMHPEVGSKILEPLGMLPHEKAIILHHHERWDGHGYPLKLGGAEIPFLVRIVSLADAYDAMTSNRVYRVGLSHEIAVKEMTKNVDRQFDRNVVRAFLSLCNRYNKIHTHLGSDFILAVENVTN